MDTLLRETPYEKRTTRGSDEMMGKRHHLAKDSARETGRCENCVRRFLSNHGRDTTTAQANYE